MLLPRDVRGYARKHGPAPQESTLPLAKASAAALPGVAALHSAEVCQL